MEITISDEQMVRAFAAWDRAWRKNPEEYTQDIVRVLRGDTPEAYGEIVAKYFQGLLIEVR